MFVAEKLPPSYFAAEIALMAAEDRAEYFQGCLVLMGHKGLPFFENFSGRLDR